MRVIAVEPHPHNISAIMKAMRNFRTNNAKCVPEAVGDANGFSKLFLAGEHGGAAIDSWNRKGEHTVVKTATLDTLLSREQEISLIKVDVEGPKFEVLKGTRRSMNNIRSWIIELHNPQARNELEELMFCRILVGVD